MTDSDGLEEGGSLEEGIDLLKSQETPTDPNKFVPRFFDPRNDIAFKKVFVNHPDLTLSFLNSTLRLHGNRTIKKVEFLPTERLPMTAESKKSILDVLCTDEKGFQYIIEVQNKSMLNYIQRIQYYGSHVFAGQLEYAGDYLNLKPVTMLSILNHAIFPHEVNYLSYHHNIEKETQVSYLDDLNYVFIELPKFNKKQEELETIEDYWIFTLKEGYHLTEIPEHAPEEVKRAYGILEKHTWTRAERLAYEQAKIALMDDEEAIRTAKIEGEQIGLEKGEQIGLEKGEQIGLEKGEQIGLEKGERRGFDKKAREVAKEMIIDGITMEKVSKLTKLSMDILAELAQEISEEEKKEI
jgi:predicted transposase/invertase (TIGR01784 family)